MTLQTTLAGTFSATVYATIYTAKIKPKSAVMTKPAGKLEAVRILGIDPTNLPSMRNALAASIYSHFSDGRYVFIWCIVSRFCRFK
jgi:hypothetical protein